MMDRALVGSVVEIVSHWRAFLSTALNLFSLKIDLKKPLKISKSRPGVLFGLDLSVISTGA